MDNGIACRPLVRQMKTASSSWRTARTKDCSLVARAAAARHSSFLGQQLGHVLSHGHGTPDRHPFQQHTPYPQHTTDQTDLTTLASLQHPQVQPSISEPSAHDFGLQPPARKPTAWTTDSHTRPANSRLAAYGCYRLVGPARISKRGDTLVAHMFRGSRIELLDRDGNATPYGSTEDQDLMSDSSSMSSPSSSEDGDAGGGGDAALQFVAECVLVAAHVELCGSACSVDLVDLRVQTAVHRHNGHTYVSVRNLPPEAVIELDADADLRHPINITPISPPAPSPSPSLA
ncbi:hypothetical protein PLESTB_000730400 [Pleodorina starrii]|uniref:Uncharacterized protein n=1 Tax=Pleodorina starrii TaxID=330485 RepID=A0A9W6BJD4_9CHLO|nr:hypothetical protein PLESTM_000193500 [Pleodorina starrii]GLC53306.1 hypothetical protein PLESTB_000730400 [Pleodorina starrii]GLC67225.1 hypothetical protein PLESTF_000530900 [Pleodorina starrii]